MSSNDEVKDTGNKKLTQRVVLFMCGALFFSGLTVFIGAMIEYVQADESGSWRSVEGRVIVSQLGRSEVPRADQTRSVIHYRPLVRYQYQVKGVTYENDTIKFAAIADSSNRQASHYLSKYPVGKQVKVYVSGNDPQRSVLEPGVSFTNHGAIFAALFFMMMGGWMFLMRDMYTNPDYMTR